MVENFPNLEIDMQSQEFHKVSNKMNPKRTTPRHITIKMSRGKDKERILKSLREKQFVMYKKTPRDCQQFSQQKLQKPERSGIVHSN